MKSDITNRITECITQIAKEYEGIEAVLKFHEAIVMSEELERMGVTQKRGNNLMSPSDYNTLNTVYFNNKFYC